MWRNRTANRIPKPRRPSRHSLHRAPLDLRDRDLRNAYLIAAWLPKADLRDAHLQGADLNYANLQGAEITGAFLGGARLVETRLDHANLSEVDLTTLPPEDWDRIAAELRASITDENKRESALGHIEEARNRTKREMAPASVNNVRYEDPGPLSFFLQLNWPPAASQEAFDAGRLPFLVELACADFYVVEGLATQAVRTRDKAMAGALLNKACSPLKYLPKDLRENLQKTAVE